MSLKNLEKVKILYGNDMQPSIKPNEMLLLDKSAKPMIGDVILFENKFGVKIAHRLIHKFAGYYFTKGDNCPDMNFPFTKDKIIGVVVGKSEKIERKIIAEMLLVPFIVQFMIYSKFFDLKKKRVFILLTEASKKYPYIELQEGVQRAEVDENGKLLPIRKGNVKN